MAINQVDINLDAANSTNYNFYDRIWDKAQKTTIDRAAETICPLLLKGETAINALLTTLADTNPGELDQSRLMKAQMDMSRWQLAAQILSNFISGVGTGLKNTVQNVGR